MSVVDEFREDAPLVIEAAMIAMHQFDENSALKLLNLAEVFVPDHVLLNVSWGYFYLAKMFLNKAAHYFGRALEQDPGHETAMILNAFCTLSHPEKVELGWQQLEAAEKKVDSADGRALIESIRGLMKRVRNNVASPVKSTAGFAEARAPKNEEGQEVAQETLPGPVYEHSSAT